MKTEALMSKSVAVCSPGDSLAAAAEIMWHRDVGFLPVVDANGRVVGTITDRDIAMGGFFNDLPLRQVPVSVVMSSDLVTCRPDQDVREVEMALRGEQVRRIPVVDRDRRLQGVLSLADLVRATRDPQLRDGLGAMDLLATYTAVCSPGEQLAQPERPRQPRRTEMRP